jgi:hypothetical protein
MRPPPRDPIGVHIKLLRQLHQPLVPTQGGNRQVRLEYRYVIPTRSLHILLSSAAPRGAVD